MSELGASLGWDRTIGYTGLILLFSAYFLALEAIFLSFARRTATRSQLSKRLSRRAASPAEQIGSLRKMREQRSLSPEGDYTMPLVWLNRLIVQSGVTWGAAAFPPIMIGLSLALLVIAWALGLSLILSGAIAVFGAAGIVILLLAYMRSRRQRRLETQLPEAVEILVRGLKAGHPVSAAIRLVARELPDPMGTEFAIVANELTYGLDLETAMNNMGSRVGQPDLALVIIAIGIQARTGGNLAEILSGMSGVVRERLKLRMKVKALSAEGRYSAMLLSILPVALFLVLSIIAPGFYGDVWQTPLVKPALVASGIWMLIGQAVMYRMVRFEI